VGRGHKRERQRSNKRWNEWERSYLRPLQCTIYYSPVLRKSRPRLPSSTFAWEKRADRLAIQSSSQLSSQPARKYSVLVCVCDTSFGSIFHSKIAAIKATQLLLLLLLLRLRPWLLKPDDRWWWDGLHFPQNEKKVWNGYFLWRKNLLHFGSIAPFYAWMISFRSEVTTTTTTTAKFFFSHFPRPKALDRREKITLVADQSTLQKKSLTYFEIKLFRKSYNLDNT